MTVFNGTSCGDFSDQELVHLMQSGNEAAFTELYNRYWDKLFAIAAHKLQNLAEAEEVVQDIYLELWNRRADLQITTSLPAYLSTAVKFKVINILALRHRRLRYQEHAVQVAAAGDLSTEQWLRFGELQSRLAALVNELPDKCRLVFRLSREEGLSHKEIAATIGVAEKTVEAHLSRALRTLRTQLRSLSSFLGSFLG